MRHAVQSEISRLSAVLKSSQSADGSWDYAFETGIITDAYMIILLRSLKVHDEKLIKRLVRRILSRQEPNGAWKLFHDEGTGNLSVTIDAYYALLYSGYIDKKEQKMAEARRFILSKGGLGKAGMFSKIMLASTGQYPWPAYFPVPVETILFPVSFPLNLYDFSVFGRANLVPILVLGNKKYKRKTENSPDLSDLYGSIEDDSLFGPELFGPFLNAIESLIFSDSLEELAFEKAEEYMLKRIEPDGTFLSYFSSTFLMIFALLSLGYSKNHPVIAKAIQGLGAMQCKMRKFTHMQYTTADVWNTSLISYALQKGGLRPEDPVIQKANRYLLSRQQYKYGDWAVHNPNVRPGGWGFSDINTMNPDIDDTTASLRAIRPMLKQQPQYFQAWERGLNWVLSMQNDDGGWPAFEKNVDKEILNLLPVQGAEFLLLDPSTADLTGRTLEFLGNYTNLNKNHPAVKKGIRWLRQDQREDGSWYGRWGICYIYGTWCALTGLAACGKLPGSSMVKKGAEWLKSIQNPDGGWGESCHSDIVKKYVPLRASTLTHTAWAVDALISVSPQTTPEIDRGVRYLIAYGSKADWTTDYPKGQGMGRAFYIHYHSYRYIWPLLALSHYMKKYENLAQQ